MADLDEVFRILSKERRRYALYYLEQQEGRIPVDEVAEQVAEWETNPSSLSLLEGKSKEIAVELKHNDLPKASEAKYVKYNPEAEVVEVTAEPPEVNAIISVAKTIERPNRNP